MENKTLKRIASHTVAVVLGLLFASCIRNTSPSIVTKEVIKEVRVEVPVQVIKEVVTTVEIEKIKYRYRNRYIRVMPDRNYTVYNNFTNVLKYRHRVYGLLGAGPRDLKTTKVKYGYEVDIKNKVVVGFGYQYSFYKNYNIGLEFLSNNTHLISYGYSF